jgi:hypothetical protein
MLANRLLQVSFQLPFGGSEPIVLDQNLHLRVTIDKQALTVQNRAIIEVANLTTSLRQMLISQFSAYKARLINENRDIPNRDWIDVTVAAGYSPPKYDTSSLHSGQPPNAANWGPLPPPVTVFKGQVSATHLISTPPNITTRIICYTRQVDRTTWPSDPFPDNTTYCQYIKSLAGQMGLNYRFYSDKGDHIIENIGASSYTFSEIISLTERLFKFEASMWIDDDMLIVKDNDAILDPDEVADITEFIGIPSWNEYGVEFVTLFNPQLRLGHGVRLHSQMNPGVNSIYGVTALEYDLTSREGPFYVKGVANPVASTVVPTGPYVGPPAGVLPAVGTSTSADHPC